MASSYVLQRFGQNKIYFSPHILSNDKFVPLRQLSEVCIINGAQGSHHWTNLLIEVLPALLRVEDAACSLLSMTSSFFISWVPARAPVSNGDFAVFLFFSIVCTYVVAFRSALHRFIPCLRSAHPAGENKSDRFLCDNVHAVCESGRISIFPRSSSSVTFTCETHRRKLFRVLETDSGSIVDTSGRRPLETSILSSSDHSPWTLYSDLLEITLLIFSKIKYDRNKIVSSTSGDRLLAVASTPSYPCTGVLSSKSASSWFRNTKPSDHCDII